jgi:hypothetical protein
MNEWLRVISESANPVQVSLSLPDLESFLLVAVICGLCVLATTLWFLAAQRYVWSQGKHA